MSFRNVLIKTLSKECLRYSTDDEFNGVLRRAFDAGVQAGECKAKGEVKQALQALGLGDMAFKDYCDD